MKIGIDARFLTHPQPGGFKTYTENLIASLAELDAENEYILYLDRPPHEGCKIPHKPNFLSKVVPPVFPVIGMPWREQIGLILQTKKDRVDLFHSPCLTAPLHLDCPLVITVHDMIWAFPEKFSNNFSWSISRSLMRWYNYLIPKQAIGRASAIITVSQAAKESIVEHLKLDESRILVSHEAANLMFQKVKDGLRIDTIRRKYDLPVNFILAIGSADPRKNISRLVQAYSLLSKELREKYKLVIVWTHSLLAHELSEQVEQFQLGSSIRFLEAVPNDDLVLLYNAASLFTFPSLYEGFGLPLLEAMACGVPVLAADNSSIPEIVDGAALLFNAEDTVGLTEMMTRVLTDESVKVELIIKGLQRARDFSWEKCARQTLSVYKNVLLM